MLFKQIVQINCNSVRRQLLKITGFLIVKLVSRLLFEIEIIHNRGVGQGWYITFYKQSSFIFYTLKI